MRKVNTGVIWTLFQRLEDIDVADDLAQRFGYMQESFYRLVKYAAQVAVRVYAKKRKLMRINTTEQYN